MCNKSEVTSVRQQNKDAPECKTVTVEWFHRPIGMFEIVVSTFGASQLTTFPTGPSRALLHEMGFHSFIYCDPSVFNQTVTITLIAFFHVLHFGVNNLVRSERRTENEIYFMSFLVHKFFHFAGYEKRKAFREVEVRSTSLL